MSVRETEEHQLLRETLSGIVGSFGHAYYAERARAGKSSDELWDAIAEAGFVGVSIPEEYGGVGLGVHELAIVCEEIAAGGCPLLMLVVLSVGFPLSALNVRFRDVRLALPLALQLWLFANPVVYSSSMVEGGWKYVYALNPMSTVLDGFRWSIADGPTPGPEALVSAAVVVVLLVGGLSYFSRAERSFADVV